MDGAGIDGQDSLSAGPERSGKEGQGKVWKALYFFPQGWQIIAVGARAKVNKRKTCRETLCRAWVCLQSKLWYWEKWHPISRR